MNSPDDWHLKKLINLDDAIKALTAFGEIAPKSFWEHQATAKKGFNTALSMLRRIYKSMIPESIAGMDEAFGEAYRYWSAMVDSPKRWVTMDKGCHLCGNPHEMWFHQTLESELGYWALCPQHMEPIYLSEFEA